MDQITKASVPWNAANACSGFPKETPYHELAAAIVKQAAVDYIRLTRALWEKDKSLKEKRKIILERDEIEDFFHSEWFEFLADIDADCLIAACKIRAREMEKEAIVRKNRRAIKKLLQTESTKKEGVNHE
jgi:hypothetical protein